MEKKYKSNNKKRMNNNQKPTSLEDEVVYRTRIQGPLPLDDWQLKLKAISNCWDFWGKEEFDKKVEARYQELLHRKG